ncbi:MAG: type II CRISPR RNA-guided endonuclease Cas9 [Enterococcus sp.]
MNQSYTIGLDIGTNSVGWAVVKDNYDLIKKKMPIYGVHEGKSSIKKNFWGVRLFDEGQTAQNRRLKRTTRRRLQRRRNRILYLQEIFAEKMKEIDSNFFQRLEDSFLIPDEKSGDRHPIFANIEEEIAYHESFPTIYHLRKYLADSDEQVDLRLVYLAVAHIIKFRGHFLIEGELKSSNTAAEEIFIEFLQQYNQVFNQQETDKDLFLADKNRFKEIISEKQSRNKKAEKIIQLFPSEKSTGNFAQFIKMIVGNQGNFKKVFDLSEDEKLQFSKEDYEEQLEDLLARVSDEYADVFATAKRTYDAIELSGILTVSDKKTNAKLSASMIQRYTDHQKDLKLLKQYIRKSLPDKYDLLFKDKTVDGYAGYIEGKAKQIDFYNYLKKTLPKDVDTEYFLTKIEQEDFLRKQRTFDNGVIPHQLQLEELEAILQNQGKYYPFLVEHMQRIKELVTFRIPYYVGPLAQGQSAFSWVDKSRSQQAIRPWNLKDNVDLGKAATEFIERMTNFDVYLPTEKVLPKHSLIYEKYMVYNELTKVSYDDDRGIRMNFSSSEKKDIFDKLFKSKRKITKKGLEEFLRLEYNIENASIHGIEDAFNAKYGTYQDLIKKGVPKELLDAPENEAQFEKLIKVLTVFEDRKMIRAQLEQFGSLLPQEVLKKLERVNYQGWGRLSAKLLTGIREKNSNKTILDYLVEDDGPRKNINRNFMQLINDSTLSFKESIEKEQLSTTTEDLHEVVSGLAGSPAIKKGILQSLKIVDELVAIIGYAPDSIVVEMARENQTTQQGRKNSHARLKTLESTLSELGSQILKEHPVDNKQLQNDRLYLYYLQDGKDMYTGEELSLSNLSHYDIDHIIPQSFITDNSLDNRVLVSSKENRGKSDDVPNKHVVDKMESFWLKLRKANSISQRKFDRLTKIRKGGLTEDDKAGFIQRQLVETRQITKHVAQILHHRFNQENEKKQQPKVKVITLKASLTSQFRQQFNFYKVREINDYHHAQDAYLNAVVAKTLLKVYPNLTPEFVYGDYHKTDMHKENRATAKKQFYTNIMRFFGNEQTIVDENGEILWDTKYLTKIRHTMNYHQMNIVRKVETQKGQFSKESILPKGDSDKLISRKKIWDTTRYGGFDSPITAYSILFTYEKGKKKKKTKALLGITIMECSCFEKDNLQFLREKGYENPQIIAKLPKYSLYELENGRRRILASAKEAQKGNQMVLPEHLVRLLYHAKHCEEPSGKSLQYIEAHNKEFQEILDYVLAFAEKYTKAEKNLTKIVQLYEENKNSAGVKVIAESFIHLMQFNFMRAPADFQFFNTKIPRLRYTKTSELFDATLIYQSITGLYETRVKVGD